VRRRTREGRREENQLEEPEQASTDDGRKCISPTGLKGCNAASETEKRVGENARDGLRGTFPWQRSFQCSSSTQREDRWREYSLRRKPRASCQPNRRCRGVSSKSETIGGRGRRSRAHLVLVSSVGSLDIVRDSLRTLELVEGRRSGNNVAGGGNYSRRKESVSGRDRKKEGRKGGAHCSRRTDM